LDQLSALVARVFDLPPNSVTDQTARGILEAWDSLNHLLLISEIEQEMHVQFTTEEVLRIKTVKDIKDVLSKKA
jgi:acyl carrier protein